jgi:hypothetical protein
MVRDLPPNTRKASINSFFLSYTAGLTRGLRGFLKKKARPEIKAIDSQRIAAAPIPFEYGKYIPAIQIPVPEKKSAAPITLLPRGTGRTSCCSRSRSLG